MAKVNRSMSEEGYIINKKWLELIDKFEQSYVDGT